ncbi:hypothetical protein HanXRQr2_Chr14g0625121 [Helianthus annuus]|uniref:Uncharacterized protein n=1 Tax=Helianthus annuus TaxID=4232 RepID=A0A9K3E7V0_HELAN|nr:hypothetical protein HanXRQr2_Chr14g0625121 [Helianthus annuus]KAJ0838879.1 hypothetical protein HanPSC8_Chr14g0599921 [Helianthus annuus]
MPLSKTRSFCNPRGKEIICFNCVIMLTESSTYTFFYVYDKAFGKIDSFYVFM